jgi:hypothetical protein
MDKIKEVLLAALKQGIAEEGEQRLYRTAKLPGLFSGKTSLNAEVAAQAVSDGLLEIVRTETKGKTATDWVRVTPRGVDYVLQHESPVRALDELRSVLEVNKEGLPLWLAEIRQSVHEMSSRLTQEVQGITRRLDGLSERVLEVLKRTEAAPQLPDGTASAIPWAQEALGYLGRRRRGGMNGPCPLPELFAILREKNAALTVKDYHTGLRRLQDREVVRLLPFEGPAELPEPEFALLDGAGVFYYVER